MLGALEWISESDVFVPPCLDAIRGILLMYRIKYAMETRTSFFYAHTDKTQNSKTRILFIIYMYIYMFEYNYAEIN